MDIVFVADREMRELNNRYLRRDYATDVLSFAYEGETVDGSPFLGEIVIAPDAAVRNAAQYGIKPEREIKKLMVHGILHLAGYDHETDDGIMQRTQAKLLRRRFFRQAPAVLRNKKVDM
jgi:probable rRNA maturation factor